MKPIFKTVGKYMRKKRIDAGFSQQEIANMMGYSSSQFPSNAERGLCMYPLGKIKKVSAALEINLSEIAGIILEERAKEINKALGL